MNMLFQSRGIRPTPVRSSPLGCLALAATFAFASSLQSVSAQSDDFNDGNDNGWNRYDALAPLGLNATYSFPNGGYRIQTTYTTGVPQNPGRSGTTRPEIYSDFYTAVDVVNWNDALPQSFGLLARIGTPGLQTTTGYAFTWDRGNPTSQTAGDFDISRITGEAPSDVSTGPSGYRLQPGRSYRLVFIGRGPALEGRVYELPDTRTPVLTIQGSDSIYTSGQNGMVVFDNSGGQNMTDATFDNFYATDVEPPRILVEDIFFGDYRLSWPADATGFVLESSTTLPGSESDWQIVAGVVENTYIFNIFDGSAAPRRFFRLVRR